MSSRMTGPKLADRVGVSYRQIDYWVRQGWLHTSQAGGGSGCPRDFSPEEIRIAEIMADLVAIGMPPERAVDYARDLVEFGLVWLPIGSHLVLREAS